MIRGSFSFNYTSIIIKNGNTVSEEKFSDPTDSSYVTHVDFNFKDYYRIRPECRKSWQQPWIIVGKSFNDGYKLRIGDIFKVGKLSFIVKELYNTTAKNKNFRIKKKERIDSWNDYEKNVVNTLEHKKKKKKNNSAFSNSTAYFKNDFKERIRTIDSITTKKKSKKCCKICLCEENDDENPLINPCNCTGSVGLTHLECLRTWLQSKIKVKPNGVLSILTFKKLECEICKGVIPQKISHLNKIYSLIQPNNPKKSFLIIEQVTKIEPSIVTLYTIEMNEDEEMFIGRESNSHIKFEDGCLSRKHAYLKLKNDCFHLYDCNSKFGTHIKLQHSIKIIPSCSLSLLYDKFYLTFKIDKTFMNKIFSCFSSSLKDVDYNSILEKEQNKELIKELKYEESENDNDSRSNIDKFQNKPNEERTNIYTVENDLATEDKGAKNKHLNLNNTNLHNSMMSSQRELIINQNSLLNLERVERLPSNKAQKRFFFNPSNLIQKFNNKYDDFLNNMGQIGNFRTLNWKGKLNKIKNKLLKKLKLKLCKCSKKQYILKLKRLARNSRKKFIFNCQCVRIKNNENLGNLNKNNSFDLDDLVHNSIRTNINENNYYLNTNITLVKNFTLTTEKNDEVDSLYIQSIQDENPTKLEEIISFKINNLQNPVLQEQNKKEIVEFKEAIFNQIKPFQKLVSQQITKLSNNQLQSSELQSDKLFKIQPNSIINENKNRKSLEKSVRTVNEMKSEKDNLKELYIKSEASNYNVQNTKEFGKPNQIKRNSNHDNLNKKLNKNSKSQSPNKFNINSNAISLNINSNDIDVWIKDLK